MVLIILFLVTVIAPILFWLRFFIWEDRSEPEPRKLLIKVFILGMGTSFLALAMEGIIFKISRFFFDNRFDIPESISKISIGIIVAFFLVSIVEELLKYSVLKEYIYKKTDFNQIADGVFYATTIALGFSVVENAFYFLKFAFYLTTPLTFWGIGIASMSRGIVTVLLHITASGIIGYSLGKMKFTKEHKKSIVAGALIIAISLHTLFNLFVSLPDWSNLAFPLVFFIFIYLLKILNKPESRLVWKIITPKIWR